MRAWRSEFDGDEVVEATPPEGNPAAARRRVLVVDDNVDAAETLVDFLSIVGHDVQMVHDGEDACEAVRALAPEVVLLDIGLPRLDGYEVARRLRAAHGRGLVLIALTGYGQEEDRRKAHAAGFDHHLVKPVDPDRLDRLLAALPPAA